MNRIKMGILITVLVLLSVASLGLNFYFVTSFAPELREKRFIDAHRDEIDLFILRDGSMLQGVIIDENENNMAVQLSVGTTLFRRSEIRKLIPNVCQKNGGEKL